MENLSDFVLEALGIHKSFGPTVAVGDVSFRCRSGEVVGLVGENGAGKSTLMKIIGGVIAPQLGEIRINNKKMTSWSVTRAREQGVISVYQEPALIPDLTVGQNLHLFHYANEGMFWPMRRPAREYSWAQEVLALYGLTDVRAESVVRDLSLPDRQRLELVRAFESQPAVLLLDEPTAALDESGVEWLYGHIQHLVARGTAVVFTSHRWKEIQAFTHKTVILRNGTLVGEAPTAEMTESDAVRLMAGAPVGTLYPDRSPANETAVLTVRELSTDRLHNVSFSLHEGEILGLGGLQGQGQESLLETLFGLHPYTGVVQLRGRAISLRSPSLAVKAGIALVPADRIHEGLITSMSVADNLTLAVSGHFTKVGIIRKRALVTLAKELVNRLRIRVADIHLAASTLSGGNQQKVVLGKWLARQPSVYCLYDVTRGVDVETKREIYRLMTEFASQGRAILFYSTDTAELVHLAHRVLIFREGRLVEELNAAKSDESAVVTAMINVEREAN